MKALLDRGLEALTAPTESGLGGAVLAGAAALASLAVLGAAKAPWWEALPVRTAPSDQMQRQLRAEFFGNEDHEPTPEERAVFADWLLGRECNWGEALAEPSIVVQPCYTTSWTIGGGGGVAEVLEVDAHGPLRRFKSGTDATKTVAALLSRLGYDYVIDLDSVNEFGAPTIPRATPRAWSDSSGRQLPCRWEVPVVLTRQDGSDRATLDVENDGQKLHLVLKANPEDMEFRCKERRDAAVAKQMAEAMALRDQLMALSRARREGRE